MVVVGKASVMVSRKNKKEAKQAAAAAMLDILENKAPTKDDVTNGPTFSGQQQAQATPKPAYKTDPASADKSAHQGANQAPPKSQGPPHNPAKGQSQTGPQKAQSHPNQQNGQRGRPRPFYPNNSRANRTPAKRKAGNGPWMGQPQPQPWAHPQPWGQWNPPPQWNPNETVLGHSFKGSFGQPYQGQGWGQYTVGFVLK